MTLISDGSRSRRGGWLAVLLLAGLSVFASASAQETPPPQPAKPAAESPPEPTAIAAADIPTRAEAEKTWLRGVAALTAPQQRTTEIEEQLTSMRAEIERLQSVDLNSDAIGQRTLRDQRGRWSLVDSRLTGWQDTIARRAQEIDTQTSTLAIRRLDWELTLESAKTADLPDALVEQVQGMLSAFDELGKILRERRAPLLTLGSVISVLNVQADDALDAIKNAEAQQRGRLLVRDAEPLWSLLSPGRQTEEDAEQAPLETDTIEAAQDLIGGEISSAWNQNLASISHYVEDNTDRVLSHIILFIVLAFMLWLLQKRREVWAPDAATPREGVVDIFAHPIASAALLALVAPRLVYPGGPLALFDLIRMMAVLPIIVLLGKALARRQHPAMYALLGLFVLDMARGLVDTQPFSSRISLLVITLLGLVVIIWTLATRRDIAGRLEGAWARVAHFVARISVVTLTASIIANIAGIVSFAELLGEGTITTIFAGFGLHALLLVLLGLLDVIMQSPAGLGIRAFKRNAGIVRERVSSGLYMIALAAWIFAMLSLFRLWPFVRDHTAGLFSSSLSVGTFQISLGDVVAFIVALWIGTLLSRFIRFILAEDVFTRVRLPRGVPATISMMVNYGIITIAFFVALAVAGFDLSRFALIAGALSVGIGFGLQNVVNNFVSGLILAFERPISVGDSVEVGPLMGRVNRIGIRSSVVRTFDGSEVIVPNADFISKEVINWTLSDVNRRLIVPAGVAYGSNPHQVLELLVKVARAHPDVLPEPEPYALFIGFGASSLDFELRAWCDFSEGLRIKTELNLGIHDAIKEAGIEIPFPQRDLHLRSVDADAGRAITGRSLLRYPSHEAPAGEDEIVQADTSVIPEAEE